jgi:hypothetical protein
VPTVLVATDAFLGLATATAEALGLPGIHIAVIAHPFGHEPSDHIQAKARAAVDAIVEGLATITARLGSDDRPGSRRTG